MDKFSHCQASSNISYPEVPRRSARILIVDDNADTIALLQMFLQGHGFDVITAPDADSAYMRLLGESADLIITDYIMPRKSGLELCRQIRSDTRVQDLPIILHTASAMGLLEPLVYNELVPKPVDLHQLLGSIEKLLRAHFKRTCGRPAESQPGGIEPLRAIADAAPKRPTQFPLHAGQGIEHMVMDG